MIPWAPLRQLKQISRLIFYGILMHFYCLDFVLGWLFKIALQAGHSIDFYRRVSIVKIGQFLGVYTGIEPKKRFLKVAYVSSFLEN